jgi:AcrR family transcriptional regulator
LQCALDLTLAMMTRESAEANVKSAAAARKPVNTYHHGDLRDALVQAAFQEAELGGPEAVNISALAKKLGVSQPAPYRHFADRDALLATITAEALRQFGAAMRESMGKPSKRSRLSCLAQATLQFGLRRNGIYRLMFASRSMANAPEGSELRIAATETFDLVLEALGPPAKGYLRERHALSIWTAVHGAVMLAEQGLLTGKAAQVGVEDLVEDLVKQTELALSLAIKAANGC